MPPRVHKKRTGKTFEDLLGQVFDAYQRRGEAMLRKTEPPVKVFGVPGSKRVVLLENPWLDYAGVWTSNGRRTLIIEAKSTDDPRLEIGEKGIKEEQILNLLAWDKAGAAVCIVWHYKGEVKVLGASTIRYAYGMGNKSFKWRHFPATPKGEGWMLWDILAALRESA